MSQRCLSTRAKICRFILSRAVHRASYLCDVSVNTETQERTDLKAALQKELQDELRRLHDDNRALQDELSTTKFEHRRDLSRVNGEIAAMSASHEKMLADIHERVAFPPFCSAAHKISSVGVNPQWHSLFNFVSLIRSPVYDQ